MNRPIQEIRSDLFNQWVCAAHTGGEGPYTAQALFTDKEDYSASNFALRIPQGTGVADRIGRDVSILKDHYRLTFTIPTRIENPADSTRYLVANNVSNRPFRIRAVCVFKDNLDITGDYLEAINKLFEDPARLDSRYNPNEVRKYKRIYDRTFTINPLPHSLYAADNEFHPGPTRYNSASYEYTVDASIRNWLRRYDDTNVDGNERGNVQYPDPGYTLTPGVSMGIAVWYFYVEDVFTPIMNADSTSSAWNAGLSASILKTNVDLHPTLGWQVEVNRWTTYTDQ